jgi:hypothetical protein
MSEGVLEKSRLKFYSSELVALSSPQFIVTPQQNGAKICATLTRERELRDGPTTGIRMLLEL